MLSKEHNEIITRVGPGTPMGTVLREFWVPACRSAKLEADGAPARVRLFGEDFVAFRATDGRVGFLNEGCPHRGVSLALARNEDCALTCIFHGWKIDVSGKVVDVPSEPTGSTLASKVRVYHYPVHEAGGLVWVWLGQGVTPPFPNYEFTALPENQSVASGSIMNVNWIQGLEANLDSSHLTTLHQSWLNMGAGKEGGAFSNVIGDFAPRYEITPRDYGYTAAAIRTLPDGMKNVRSTQYALPWNCFIPLASETMRNATMIVPIDDEHVYSWNVIYDLVHPVDFETTINIAPGKVNHDPDNIYEPHYGADKIWGQDREMMKQGHYTGIQSFAFEDFVIQESMGPIVDRSKEHLGTSDAAIIRMRRLLLDMAKSYQEGKNPQVIVQNADYSVIHGTHETFEPNEVEVHTTV